MSTQPPLFETRTPQEIRAEQEERIDKQILDVLCDRGPGPITQRQRDILHLLRYRRGCARAIQIGEMAEKLKTTPRQIKEDIADLSIRFRLPIGSSRDAESGGYYLCITQEERIATATPHIHQAMAHLRRANVVLDPKEMSELMGQLLLDGEI